LRKAEKAKSDQEQKVAALQKMVNDHRESSEKEMAERIKQIEKELAEQSEKEKQSVQEQAEADKKAMQLQLDKLNQQLARSNNEQFLRAKVAIDQIVKDGDTLVKAIAAVTEADEQTKLKTAAATIVEKLRSML
ncbi:hypothetical protein, partial [Mycobacterium tuberculosis]|uniref:hypothetical protein n=1 Tax=Mycobacterium tuberculosis TaxID=1773 RepID=UPI001BDBB076